MLPLRRTCATEWTHLRVGLSHMSKSAFLPRRGRWPIGPEGDSVSRHEDRRCDEDRVPLRPSGTSPCGGGNRSSKIICDSPPPQGEEIVPRCVHSVAYDGGGIYLGQGWRR